MMNKATSVFMAGSLAFVSISTALAQSSGSSSSSSAMNSSMSMSSMSTSSWSSSLSSSMSSGSSQSSVSSGDMWWLPGWFKKSSSSSLSSRSSSSSSAWTTVKPSTFSVRFFSRMLCADERGTERARCIREYRTNGMNHQDPEELVQTLMKNLDDHFFRTHSKGWWKAHCKDFFVGMTTAQCETMMQPTTAQTSSMDSWMQDWMKDFQKKMPSVKGWSSTGQNTSAANMEWSSVSPDGSMKQYYKYQGTQNGGNSTVNISTSTSVKTGNYSSN